MKTLQFYLAILLGTLAASAQAPKVPDKPSAPTSISIADKAKKLTDGTSYETLQLRIKSAADDVQNTQLQIQSQVDRAMAQPTAQLRAILEDTMKALGVPATEIDQWQYNPQTQSFDKKVQPPNSQPVKTEVKPPVPPAVEAAKPAPEQPKK